jgi:hypothetical protein
VLWTICFPIACLCVLAYSPNMFDMWYTKILISLVLLWHVQPLTLELSLKLFLGVSEKI